MGSAAMNTAPLQFCWHILALHAKRLPGSAGLSDDSQVGLVTSVTYLTVAYTLPSAFCLKLLRRKQPRWENALQVLWSLSGPCCSPKCCFLTYTV
jgi:hypothetical protein